MIREAVDVMVFFEKNSVNPMVITYSRGNLKISKIIKSYRERRCLRECYIYLCKVEGKDDPVELRWDIESNMWYIEKC
jgi:hypothetical protein